MTDPTPAGGYAHAESFEPGQVTAVAADSSRVVVGTAAGTVEVVTLDGRTTVTLDAPITDLAVGDRVYALADGTVSALSSAGTRVWSVDLPEARRLAALPGPGVLGAVTEDSLFGFEAETGKREFEVDRPYVDVTDTPGFLGTEGAFVFVAWSFLAVLNLDGTDRFDMSFDGAVESAGVVDDTVVVSLKDGRAVGVHETTGERRWERDLTVTDLPDRADDALLFEADGRLGALRADGTDATVGDHPGGDIHPTGDGSLFCAVTDDAVRVYAASGDPAESLSLSAAADDPAIVPGATDAVSTEVRNEGDRPVEATLEADGDGVSLGEATRHVDLAPGESETWRLGVEEVVGDDAAVAVAADGESVGSVPLSVADRDGGSLVADVDLAAVNDGVATIVAAIENEGDAPATGVAVSPGETDVGRLAPGESATAALDADVDLGASVPVSVEADRDAVDLEATVPDDGVVLDVEAASDGFVDVRVENATDARLADDLVVAGECVDRRVERRVDLSARGTLVLALGPGTRLDAGSVEARLVGLGVERSVELPLDDADVRRADRDGRSSPRSAAPVTAEDDRRGTDATGRGDRTDREDGSTGRGDGVGRSHGTDSEDSAGGDVEEPDSEDSAGGDVEEPDSEEATPDSGRSASEAGTASLAAERAVETDAPDRTRAVGERLVVRNEGEATAEDVTVELPDEAVSLGAIRPGETATAERRHAFAETGEVALPAVTVTAANAPDAEVAERTLAVGPAEFAVDAEFESSESDCRLRIAVTNDRNAPCEVSRVGVRGVGVWDENSRVPPGGTVELTRTVEPPDAETTELRVEYAYPDGEPDRWSTLARTPGRAEGLDALTATIGEETRVSDEYGSVVLVVENQSESPVTGLSVEATGEDVSDLMYGGAETVEELAPGDSVTHLVDVETDDPEATVSVVLSTDDEETRLTLDGPAPPDGEWSQSALEAWRVGREDGGDATGGSDHIATEFDSR